MSNCMAQNGQERLGSDRAGEVPGWVPVAARNYIAHTEGGQTIRALAREAQVHPSTILRRVRRVEASRDDPLVDSALRQLTRAGEARDAGEANPESLAQEAVPVLRRLAEAGAVLAVARDMEKGVIVREERDGEPTRLAVVDRRLAEAMALRDWITCQSPEARIRRYRITTGGRTMLRRGLEPARPGGMAEAPASFLGPQPVETPDEARLRHMRSSLAESPLAALARRRDMEGRPFLPREMVVAGERLREDFEIAQDLRGPGPDWEALLDRLPRLDQLSRDPLPSGPRAARARIERALADLGPGLADVALRCCCLLEGLEQVERRLGWSARSGKVVLRIALERLAQHYRAEEALIG
nr:DUF6456 domain-containing protein [Rubellimicrobium arenae]